MIAECIEEHHRDLAHDTAPELFPISASTIWSEYLADHGLAGQLHIQSKSRGRDPVTFEAKATSGHHVLALGEPFALRLENSRPGSCMGYQIYREKWYLFQLTTSEGYLQTDGGQITLPQEANGRPVHMIEREHRGVHHFVIVVADQGAGRVYLKRPIGLRGR